MNGWIHCALLGVYLVSKQPNKMDLEERKACSDVSQFLSIHSYVFFCFCLVKGQFGLLLLVIVNT